MAIFRFFKMATVCHIGLDFEDSDIKCLVAKMSPCVSPSQISSKLVKRLRRYRDLTFFKMEAAAILDKKIKFLTTDTLERPNMRNCAIFHQDRSIRCWDMAIFRFSRWRPSAMLDAEKAGLSFGTVRSTHTLHFVKLGRNRSNGCEDIAI